MYMLGVFSIYSHTKSPQSLIYLFSNIIIINNSYLVIFFFFFSYRNAIIIMIIMTDVMMNPC